MDAFCPCAYAVTHHVLFGLAESIRRGLYDTNIHVLWVEPPTLSPATDFFANNPGTRERLPHYFHSLTKTSEAMAAMIIKGMEKRGRIITTLPTNSNHFNILLAFEVI